MATNAPKKPMDRRAPKPKKPTVRINGDGCFEFTHEGRTYASEKSVDEIITVGMVMDHGDDEAALTVALLRALFDDDEAATALRAIPLKAVMGSMETQLASAGQATMGEDDSSPQP